MASDLGNTVPAAAESNVALSSRASERILLIEDEEHVRRLLTHALRREGYEVVAAVAQELRRARPDLHVLYMSGYTDHHILDIGPRQPRTTFLQKPFTGSQLARKVRELLDA